MRKGPNSYKCFAAWAIRPSRKIRSILELSSKTPGETAGYRAGVARGSVTYGNPDLRRDCSEILLPQQQREENI